MISNWLSATLVRRNIHYGWVMVAVTFLAVLFAGRITDLSRGLDTFAVEQRHLLPDVDPQNVDQMVRLGPFQPHGFLG